MRVLFVTPFLPYPPVSGGRLQTFLRLTHLKKRGNSVFLVSLGLPNDSDGVLALRGMIDGVECLYIAPDRSKIRDVLRKSLLYELFTYDRRFGETMGRFAHSMGIDVVVFEGLGVAQYRDAVSHLPAVLYEHNVEYEITGHLVSYLRKSLLKIFGGRADETMRNVYLAIFGSREKELVRTLERGALKKFDLILTCSERDAEILKREAIGVSPLAVPWGVEMPDRHRRPEERDVRNLVFVGSMAWEPNRDAVRWFAKEIFPLVRKSCLRTRLVIAGSYMSGEIAALDNRDDIIVKGFVKDVSEVLSEADVFVAPVRLGSGVNVKVIEAMAFGIPVVTTPKGAEGIEARDGEHLMIAGGKEEFASAIGYLLEDQQVRISMGDKAREFIAEHHGIDKVTEIFEKALSSVLRKRESGHQEH